MHLHKMPHPFCSGRSGERPRIRIDGQHIYHMSVRGQAKRDNRTKTGVDTRNTAIGRTGKIVCEYQYARRSSTCDTSVSQKLGQAAHSQQRLACSIPTICDSDTKVIVKLTLVEVLLTVKRLSLLAYCE